MKSAQSVVVDLSAPLPASASMVTLRVRLKCVAEDGTLWVHAEDGHAVPCDWLQSPWAVALAEGDELVALVSPSGGRGVVMGRIGRFGGAHALGDITLNATQSLTMKCGDSSVDLRADGKVLIKGEDVTVRAKGTQRIRAGTVSIN